MPVLAEPSSLSRIVMLMMKSEWLRDDSAFMLVAAIDLFWFPCAIRLYTSVSETTYYSVTPSMYTPLPFSSWIFRLSLVGSNKSLMRSL